MKKIKTFVGVALVGLMLAFAAQSYAQTPAELPRGGTGVGHFDPSFIGIQVMKIEGTVAPYQIVSDDAGLLYAICRQDETEGTYAIAYDYTTTLVPLTAYIAIVPLNAQAVKNALGALSPYVYSSGAITGYRAPAQWGCWVPPWPVRFEDGLIGINDGASGYSLFYYRTDEGTNPYALKGAP